MVPSADTLRLVDEFARSGLKESRNMCFWGLIAFTAMVVIGVALDEAETFSFLRLSPKGFIDTASRQRQSCIRRIATFGWILLVIGVAGEGIFEFLVSTADGFLQEFNSVLLADAQRRTAEANERAADAELRSKQLLAQMQPRDLSSTQQREIGNSLRRFTKHGQLVVLSFMGDAESFRLCDQIVAALRYGKLSPMDLCSSNPLPPKYHPVFGVQLGGPASEHAMVSAIGASLRSIGRLRNVYLQPDMEAISSGSIVTVGLKPSTPLEGPPLSTVK